MTVTFRRRRSTVVALGGVAVATGTWAVLGSTEDTAASFTDSGTARGGNFSAASDVPAVASVICRTSDDVVAWTAPAGPRPSGYELAWSYSGGSGVVRFPADATSGRPPSPTISGNRSFTVTVAAVYGENWLSDPSPAVSIRGQNSAGTTTWTC